MAARLPPVSAIFLTHFDETKGQSVRYYKSYDETELPSGTIEHSSLPSGLHGLDDDYFVFRHGGLPTAALFRNRPDVGSSKRGRRMASLGVVLDEEAPEGVFGIRDCLEGLFDRVEALEPSAFSPDGSAGLRRMMDEVWNAFGSGPTIRAGGSTAKLRRMIDTSVTLDSHHPLAQLPALVDLLGPKIMTIYKAALSGRRILIYSHPPLHPVSAYAWCIAAMSLPPRDVDVEASEWVGQVGLMDIDSLSKRTGPWVASTSDKIILANTKLYDLSLDLSSPCPEITSTYPPPPRPLTYAFSDIPQYRTLQVLASSSPEGEQSKDWWIALYDLVDKLWAVCAGVCEYAVGRGRVGQIALNQNGEDEDARLLEDDEDGGLSGMIGDRDSDEAASRGRLIMRQLYHSTYHNRKPTYNDD